MSKKPTAKEKRMADQNRRREVLAKNAAIRDEENQRRIREEQIAAEARKRQEHTRKLQAIADEVIKNDPAMATVSKSNAKAAGVKSTFILNPNALLMTAFARGNQAIPEKYLSSSSDKIQTLQTPENYTADLTDDKKDIHVHGRAGIEATLPNLLTSDYDRSDQIHLREPLERTFFGSTFQDNLHIQVAYNILDIDKILSLHVNNIIYTINNLLRDDQFELFDLVGDLSFATSTEGLANGNSEKLTLFNKLIQQPQLGYFGNVLWDNKAIKDIKESKCPSEQKKQQIENKSSEMSKRALALLSVLGEIRQSNAHGSIRTWTGIYRLDAEHDQEMQKKSQNQGERKEKAASRISARDELDKLYNQRIDEVNNGFLKKANTDLHILFSVLGAHTADKQLQIACDYYDFIVKKTYKNLGFSIKKLRQQIVMRSANDNKEHALSDSFYDSVRHKLNHLLDFTIFQHYINNPAAQDQLIEQLRTAVSEAWKEAIYQEEAHKVWTVISNHVYEDIIPHLNGNKLQRYKGEQLVIDTEQLKKVFLTTDASYFSKAVYLMTRFLDAKEINDLLTTLINKFDNIASLIEVMNSTAVNCPPVFAPEFSLFSKSKQIVEELKHINSFARMSERSDDARGIMYEEAAMLLGFNDEDDMKIYIKNMLDRNCEIKSGQKKKDYSFRNFIANNVIKSDRFLYLVRYANPRKVRALASNQMVVRFVLNDIPDAQILRYYNTCEGVNETECTDSMRTALCNRIVNLSFREFEDVNLQDKDLSTEKERKKGIVRLYLTVMYLLVKNLVYVNSRYFLAFHCAERDALLFDFEKYKDVILNTSNKDYILFATEYLQEYPHLSRLSRRLKENNAPRLPSKVQKLLLSNIQNSDIWACRTFRNKTEHLEAVRNADLYIGDLKEIDSYFSLYHYLMQRTIINQFTYEDGRVGSKSGQLLISKDMINPKMCEYFNAVTQYHAYCKDLVKALCVPFAYNFPRYKNLTIDGLFDRNRPGEKDS